MAHRHKKAISAEKGLKNKSQVEINPGRNFETFSFTVTLMEAVIGHCFGIV